MTATRQGYDVSAIPCPACGESAHRLPVYQEQYVFTESGGRSGKMGRAGSQVVSAAAESVARNSATIEKETGVKSGPRLG